MSSSDDPRFPVGSIDELLADATDRSPLDASDGKSGNRLERVTIHGRRLVVKHQRLGDDWIMRLTGDHVFWPWSLWNAGIFERVPPTIDHAVMAMALDAAVDGEPARLAILMEDVTDQLIPEGDHPIPPETNEALLRDMASLHAAFWGWHDYIGLQTMAQRLLWFSPASIAPELTRDEVPVPIQVAHEGWRKLADVAPDLSELVVGLHHDPRPLIDQLAATPATFLHGDWKLGNVGRHADGRTILLDWAYPGSGPGCWDLAWYLALNRARLPVPKERCIELYREGLAQHGVDTAGWFDQQLDLCLLGIMVLFAWEKAVGDADELAWWRDAALRGAARLPAS